MNFDKAEKEPSKVFETGRFTSAGKQGACPTERDFLLHIEDPIETSRNLNCVLKRGNAVRLFRAIAACHAAHQADRIAAQADQIDLQVEQLAQADARIAELTAELSAAISETHARSAQRETEERLARENRLGSYWEEPGGSHANHMYNNNNYMYNWYMSRHIHMCRGRLAGLVCV